MVANLNRDAGYTNATAFFSSKLIVDNKGGPYTYEAKRNRGITIIFPIFLCASHGYF